MWNSIREYISFPGAAWALMLLGGYGWLTRASLHPPRSARWAIAIIVLVALVVRLVPIFSANGSGYDIGSYQIVADLVLRARTSTPAPIQ